MKNLKVNRLLINICQQTKGSSFSLFSKLHNVIAPHTPSLHQSRDRLYGYKDSVGYAPQSALADSPPSAGGANPARHISGPRYGYRQAGFSGSVPLRNTPRCCGHSILHLYLNILLLILVYLHLINK